MSDTLTVLRHFLTARRRMGSLTSADRLERHRNAKLARFRQTVLRKSPFYARMWDLPLDRMPIMDKASYLANFDIINTVGISLDQAMTTAVKAERDRDFSPTLGGITVGLSSGTSGRRGIFLASKAERLLWAGTMLAKALPRSILFSHRIAFFLRANSNLYMSLARGRHISFDFYDLTIPVAEHVDR